MRSNIREMRPPRLRWSSSWKRYAGLDVEGGTAGGVYGGNRATRFPASEAVSVGVHDGLRRCGLRLGEGAGRLLQATSSPPCRWAASAEGLSCPRALLLLRLLRRR